MYDVGGCAHHAARYHARTRSATLRPQPEPLSTDSGRRVSRPRSAAHSPSMRSRLSALSARLSLLAGIAGFLMLVWPVASAAASDQWQWPLDPPHQVVRGFDPPESPYGPGHRGVDLASTPHAAVRAAGAGRVGFAGMLAGRGVVTVLHAGGLKTTYEPVAAAVSAGDRVQRGDLLGHLQAGHPGCPVAACLHWGLRRGDTYLDPLSLVGAGRVRLLPLGTDRPLPGALPAAGTAGAAAGLAVIPVLRRRRRLHRTAGRGDGSQPGATPHSRARSGSAP